MTFEQLRNIQSEIYRILQNSYYLEKLSHAYIFEGVQGSGKEEMALYMAMQLLCSSDSKPCFECSSCRKVQANSHINVMIIEPENELIKKNQIEELIHEFSMSSIEGKNQIYIIKEAEKMNSSASNALLKFLEEPVANRYGFLITSNINRLLPTIVSRSQVMHFKRPSKTALLDTLTGNGIDLDIAYASLSLTNDIDEINTKISEGKIITFVQLAKDVVSAVINKEDPYIVYFLQREVLLEEENRLWHRFFFDVLILIYQEMLKLNISHQCKYFKSLLNHKKITLERQMIEEKIKLISEYQERLNYYVNITLFYASFFCELAKEKN